MFNSEQPIYSRPDGSYVITYAGNPFHLVKDDPTMPVGLWDEVEAFIAANPDRVQPEPEPEPSELPEFEIQTPQAESSDLEKRVENIENTLVEIMETFSEIETYRAELAAMR